MSTFPAGESVLSFLIKEWALISLNISLLDPFSFEYGILKEMIQKQKQDKHRRINFTGGILK